MCRKKAFSLLELTIAITAISLLISIAVGARKLSNNAALAGLIAEIARIQNAVNGFYTEFGQLPGDFDNSNALWGLTNGNGDGRIEWTATEFHYYRELDKAGYLSEHLIGGHDVRTFRSANFGDKQNDVLYLAVGDIYGYNTSNTPLTYTNSAKRGENYLQYARAFPATQFGATLGPKDAYFIDKKLDDGRPYKGHVLGMNGYNEEQNTTNYTNYVNCESSGVYNISLSYVACRLAVKLEAGND